VTVLLIETQCSPQTWGQPKKFFKKVHRPYSAHITVFQPFCIAIIVYRNCLSNESSPIFGASLFATVVSCAVFKSKYWWQHDMYKIDIWRMRKCTTLPEF